MLEGKGSRVASLFVAFLLLLAACSGEGEEGGGTEDEPIIIGAAIGLTGLMEVFDGPPLRAAELAVEDINAEGGVLGRPLEIRVADSKSDKTQAGVAANQLLDEGAQFIIAPCDFDFGAAAAIAAQEREVLALSPCAGTVQFGLHGIGKYAFTMGSGGAEEISALSEWAYEEKGWRKAYALQDDFSEYHKQSCRAFAAKWNSLPGTTLLGVDHFQQDDPSLASQVSRIRSLDEEPDFITLCTSPPGGTTAIRQIRAAGIDTPLVAEGMSWDADYWKDAVPDLSDFYMTVYRSLYGDDPDDRWNDLLETYKAEVDEPITSSFFVTGYSTIEAFKLAAERAGSLSGPALVREFENFQNEDFMVGPTTYSSELHQPTGRESRIMQVQNGETSLITTWTAKSVPPVEEWAQ